MIDWSNLQQPLDERLFRQMCSDLLSALGLRVEAAPSPSQKTLLLLLDEAPPIRVECCPQQAREENEIERVIDRLVSMGGERSDRVVIFTNLPLSEGSKQLLERLNDSERCGMSIGYVEGSELERLLACQRKVYRKYFRGQPSLPGDLDCAKIRSPNVICSFASSTRFLQKDTEMSVRLWNTGPSPLEVEVLVNGRRLKRLAVGTFGRETFSLPVSQLDTSEWPAIEVVPVGEAASALVVDEKPVRPRLPIDHVYVDPLDWRGSVRRSVSGGSIVYLSGGPGAGKSRLLREALDVRLRPAWIDLSQGSYGTALVDHLLARIFDLDLATVRLLQDGFLASRLQELGCDQREAQSVVRYVKEDVESVGKRAFSRILVRLAAAALADRVLIIDNVHRSRHLDAELLRALLSSEYSGSIVLTARDQEIEDPELMALLVSSSNRERFVRIVLDQLPVTRLIGRFLDEASADPSSRNFLGVLRHAPNMQQFMLAIKSFCARHLIEQQEDGRFRVCTGGEQIKMADYRELLDAMLAALGRQSDAEALKRALENAAAYGFSFDIRYLAETLGSDADPLLELLEEKELLVPEDRGRPDHYRFDHELTHEIVYRSIPVFRRSSLHRRVIGFMEDRSRYRAGADDAELSRHYEAVQDFAGSADYALTSAVFLLRRSGLSDGHAQYERALALAESLRLASISPETDARSYVLEAHALEGYIDSGSAVTGETALFHQVRKLDTLMKLYPAGDSDKQRLEGRVAFYFGRHFNLVGENEKARPYILEAIDRLRSAQALSELGEALARACTLEKNCSRWEAAALYGKEAVAVLEEAGDLEGLSQAYGNLGAVFLEQGEPTETVSWWQRAVEVVEGRGQDQAVCTAQVNYAYILALVTPEAPEVERELHRACDLAKRLVAEYHEARARLNLANWIFFHGDELASMVPHLERAGELITKHDSEYLRYLYSFSFLNMDRVNDDERQRLQAEISEMACSRVERQGGIAAMGDNRILNMVEYLALRGVERARDLVAAATARAPEAYYRELPNPYRRAELFITLY